MSSFKLGDQYQMTCSTSVLTKLAGAANFHYMPCQSICHFVETSLIFLFFITTHLCWLTFNLSALVLFLTARLEDLPSDEFVQNCFLLNIQMHIFYHNFFSLPSFCSPTRLPWFAKIVLNSSSVLQRVLPLLSSLSSADAISILSALSPESLRKIEINSSLRENSLKLTETIILFGQ